MSKEKSLKELIGSTWGLSMGFYPGILLGIRTYENEVELVNSETDEKLDCFQRIHTLYLPFIEIVLETYSRK